MSDGPDWIMVGSPRYEDMPDADYVKILERICRAHNWEIRQEQPLMDGFAVYPIGYEKYCLLHSKGKYHGLLHPVCAISFDNDKAACCKEMVRGLLGHSVQDVSKKYPDGFVDMPDTFSELMIKLDLLGV